MRGSIGSGRLPVLGMTMSIDDRFATQRRPGTAVAAGLRLLATGVLLATLGCDPPVDVDEQPATSTASGTSASTTGASTSDSSATPDEPGSTSSMDEPDPDTATETDDDDEYECGCDPLVPVDFEQVVANEMSAASVLSLVREGSTAFEWVGLSGDPTTTVFHIDLTYEGGQVMHGPDGEDGCGFLSAPCHNTLRIPVTARVSTEDGILSATVPSMVDLDLDRYALAIFVEGNAAFDQIGGTLSEHVEEEYETLRMGATWDLEGSWEHLWIGGGIGFDSTVLGQEE